MGTERYRNRAVQALAKQLEEDLLKQFGSPMLQGDDLRAALGYSSQDAFRQALVRRTVPVPVFSIENRRGKYALVKDVASWLARKRTEAAEASGLPT